MNGGQGGGWERRTCKNWDVVCPSCPTILLLQLVLLLPPPYCSSAPVLQGFLGKESLACGFACSTNGKRPLGFQKMLYTSCYFKKLKKVHYSQTNRPKLKNKYLDCRHDVRLFFHIKHTKTNQGYMVLLKTDRVSQEMTKTKAALTPLSGVIMRHLGSKHLSHLAHLKSDWSLCPANVATSHLSWTKAHACLWLREAKGDTNTRVNLRMQGKGTSKKYILAGTYFLLGERAVFTVLNLWPIFIAIMNGWLGWVGRSYSKCTRRFANLISAALPYARYSQVLSFIAIFFVHVPCD